MLTRNDIIEKAFELGFEDVGFTTAEPFDAQLVYLRNHQEEYGWTEKVGLGLMTGTDPKAVMPAAKSIIVLMESYFREAFPPAIEGHFGRCYLDDDRVTKGGLALRIKAFRSFLRKNGIDSKVPFNLPHRAAAMRAGMGTLGKNALLYSNRAALISPGCSPSPWWWTVNFPRFSSRWPGLPRLVQKRVRCRLPHAGDQGKRGNRSAQVHFIHDLFR